MKDVIIAGLIVVACISLVVVAFILPVGNAANNNLNSNNIEIIKSNDIKSKDFSLYILKDNTRNLQWDFIQNKFGTLIIPGSEKPIIKSEK